MEPVTIRTIQSSDNPILADIIRNTLLEFNAAKPGTVYFDPTTDHLFEVFSNPRSLYLVAEMNDEIIGGGGIFPTPGLPEDTCELVKFYLTHEARGKGIGKMLMTRCEIAARALGYKNIYLETMAELIIAVPLYERMGYRNLRSSMGSSGHSGCDIWMGKVL